MTEVRIEKEDLLSLIHWARRYCDGRPTHAPSEFNSIYKKLRSEYPDLMRQDQLDRTLSNDACMWPYAQDGMAQWMPSDYDPVNNVGWNARG